MFLFLLMTHRIGRDRDITRRRSEGRQPRQVMDEEEHYIVAPEPRPQQSQFTGGLYDMSLMVRYQDRVARHLWFDEIS